MYIHWLWNFFQVYVELNATEEDKNTQFDKSRFYNLLDRYQNTINIQVSLPSLGNKIYFYVVCVLGSVFQLGDWVWDLNLLTATFEFKINYVNHLG